MRYPFNGNYPINSPYGVSRPGHIHRGVDFGCPVGTPMICCQDGRVVYAGTESAAGNHLVILLDRPLTPWVTRYGYMHLSRFDVGLGQHVSTGQQVGLSGGLRGAPGSGDSRGPHLHFWTGLNANLGAVDPMPYLSHGSDPMPPLPVPPLESEEEEMLTATTGTDGTIHVFCVGADLQIYWNHKPVGQPWQQWTLTGQAKVGTPKPS